MDKITTMIGEEAGPHVTLRKLQEERKKLEGLSPPEKKNRFEEWGKNKEKELKAQIEQIAINVVASASRDVSSIWSEELLLEYTQKNLEKEQVKVMWPVVMLSYLPLVIKALEEACYRKERQVYDQRFQDIDQSIANTRAVIKKPFSPDLINTDPRFPIDRVAQSSDGKFYDKWLSDGLKSKPIFFDNREKYVDALCRFYHEVYWKIAEEERAAKTVPPPSPEPEKPLSIPIDNSQERVIQAFQWEVQDERIESGGLLRDRISRIYKGGKQR